MAYLHTVNFGLGKTGLSTVGYTLYKNDGTVYSARSTSGVIEFGSTGIYGANITLPDTEDILILWDTGDASIRYGSDDAQVQLSMIQQETSEIRKIWNSLKNQGEFVSILMEKFGLLEKNIGLISKNDLTKKDFESIINSGLSSIKLPEIKPFPQIPDYSEDFRRIESLVLTDSEKIRSMASNQPKEYSKNFQNLEKVLDGLKNELASHKKELAIQKKENISFTVQETNSIKSRIDNLSKNITQIISFFSKIDLILQRISDLNMNIVNDNGQIEGVRKKLQDDIKSINQMSKMIFQQMGVQLESNKDDLLISLGHRIK